MRDALKANKERSELAGLERALDAEDPVRAVLLHASHNGTDAFNIARGRVIPEHRLVEDITAVISSTSRCSGMTRPRAMLKASVPL